MSGHDEDIATGRPAAGQAPLSWTRQASFELGCPVRGGEIGDAVVRAENLIRGCDQQRWPPCRPAVMITGHVPAVHLPPDHADDLLAAAVPA